MASEKIFKWVAEYQDGTTLKEDEILFDSIDKSKLKHFMLKSMNNTFCHDVEKGIVTFDDLPITMLLNDNVIGRSTDIINYKEKAKMLTGGNTEIENHIIGYYTGWKEKNDLFEKIEVLFWVDMLNGEIKIRLRVTPKDISVINSTFTLIAGDEVHTVELKCSNVMKREEFIFELFKEE